MKILVAVAIPVLGSAQTAEEPFKVGTFEIDGEPRVSIVLRDNLIVDIEEANRALERSPNYPSIPPPADMIELIERYDYGVKRRLYEIVNDLVENDMLGTSRPEYVHALADVRTLPPIMYPGKIRPRASPAPSCHQ